MNTEQEETVTDLFRVPSEEVTVVTVVTVVYPPGQTLSAQFLCLFRKLVAVYDKVSNAVVVTDPNGRVNQIWLAMYVASLLWGATYVVMTATGH